MKKSKLELSQNAHWRLQRKYSSLSQKRNDRYYRLADYHEQVFYWQERYNTTADKDTKKFYYNELVRSK